MDRNASKWSPIFINHSLQFTALIVYVDYIIVTCDDPKEDKILKEYLATDFEINDLRDLKYFLGIEVTRSEQGIFISCRMCFCHLLLEMEMLGCKDCDAPIDES